MFVTSGAHVLPAGPSGVVVHTALSCAAGNPELAVKAKQCGLFPGKYQLAQLCSVPAMLISSVVT